jgi:hypothetical protein
MEFELQLSVSVSVVSEIDFGRFVGRYNETFIVAHLAWLGFF